MRNFLFAIAIAGVTLAGCSTKLTYTINGTVDGVEEGEVYVIAMKNGEQDTLAKTNITEGKFLFTGEVEEIVQAYFVVKEMRGATPFFLENGVYTVSIGRNGKIEGGGENQNVMNQISALQQSLYEKQGDLRRQFGEAHQAEDQERIEAIQKEFSDLNDEAEEKEDAILKENSDLPVAAFIIASSMGGMSFDELKEKFDILGENAKNSTIGKHIAERIQKLEAVAIGQVAPDFTLETPDGGEISLYGVNAKLKLIDFWASWCGPCRGENPNVVALYEEYHPKGLEIIGVSLDNDRDAWLKAIADDNLTWLHGSDLKGWQAAPAQLYAVNGIPHTVLLDENNVIIAKNLRGDKLKAKVSELLD